ncbi:LysE family transporter [Paenibacillus glycanilyticus]|uniref:LysE family translocator n=1 Tax=Paenibacillus glycanilyticus TaxID=126569 RepID=UPI002041F8F2|nr:LysE family transporter [Paenibacillus glycanilyticus]MCM3626655.1 LysE family transporter [Paenibacillus glycanilyticus]
MDLSSFFIYCIIATFTPGPTNILILSTVTSAGTGRAMKFSYGSAVGFGLLLVLSAALNTLLLTVMPRILVVMQLAGSLYMVCLAYRMVKKNTSPKAVNQTASFLSGFVLQFLNPKTVLFAMTVLPTFIMPYYSGLSMVSLSILVITLIGFSAFLTWVLFGAVFKEFLHKHHTAVNLIMALFLAYAAIMIWE